MDFTSFRFHYNTPFRAPQGPNGKKIRASGGEDGPSRPLALGLSFQETASVSRAAGAYQLLHRHAPPGQAVRVWQRFAGGQTVRAHRREGRYAP